MIIFCSQWLLEVLNPWTSPRCGHLPRSPVLSLLTENMNWYQVTGLANEHISLLFLLGRFCSLPRNIIYLPLIETESIVVHFRIHPTNPIRSHIINKHLRKPYMPVPRLCLTNYEVCFGSLPTILVNDNIVFYLSKTKPKCFLTWSSFSWV